MSLQWSGLSPDLMLAVDRTCDEPLRSQVERQIRDAIRSGRLGIGERLPSSRELARSIGLSRGVVQECYAQLRAEGYLVTHIGSATRVAAGGHAPPVREEARAAHPNLIADFQPGVPDLSRFPLTDWLWAVRDAGRNMSAAEFGYGDPRGSRRLREVVAGYVRRVRAAAADPERVVICSGYAQGLSLALRSLAQNGIHMVAYEDPGSPVATTSAAALAGMSAVPVPVDPHGLDVEALAATDARAVIVTPAHQWPTGVALTAERRRALIDWAVRRDAVIIEDDYDAEFRYDREPVGALQGLAPERVIAIGTVSKSLAPALRIGWLVCPPALAVQITEIKHVHDRGSPALDQLALARMIESGRYDRHLRRMRTTYSARRATLVAAFAEAAPNVKLTGLAAGFHAIAHLEPLADEQAVVTAARDRSVGLYGMSLYRSTHATASAQLVLGFGNLSDRAIVSGITEVRHLLS